MKLNVQSGRPVLLVNIIAMWGAVEWILPICSYIRKHYPDIQIKFLITQRECESLFKGNKELWALTEEIIAQSCYDMHDIFPAPVRRVLKFFYQQAQNGAFKSFWSACDDFIFRVFKVLLWKGSLKKWLWENQVRTVVMDSPGAKGYLEIFKGLGIKTGYFPTATSFELCMDIDVKDIESETIGRYRALGYDHFDFFLVDTVWRRDFFAKYFKVKVFLAAPPKYDSFWMEFMRRAVKEEIRTKQKKVVVFLKNDSSPVYSYLNFENSLESLISGCMADPDIFLIIKPHPRQDRALVEKVLDRFPRERWQWTQESSLTLVEKADIIISMPSGVILSVLITQKPVIEYFDFTNVPPGVMGWISARDENGKVTSIHRKLGLVYGADNTQELYAAFKQIADNDSREKYDRLRGFFPDGGCALAAEALLGVMGIASGGVQRNNEKVNV